MRASPTPFVIVFLIVLSSCEGSGVTRTGARDAAARKTCDLHARCGEIGAGKTYETRESCDVDQRAKWENAWPSAECDGKISQAAFDLCLSTIGAAECMNPGDFLNILDTCAKAKVCVGSSPDASGG